MFQLLPLYDKYWCSFIKNRINTGISITGAPCYHAGIFYLYSRFNLDELKILFVYLTAFSRFGGIEKFNKAFIKALSSSAIPTQLISLYDAPDANTSYSGKSTFIGYNGNRLSFIPSAIKSALKQNVLFIGHVNLAFLACIKIIKPSLKVIFITHGIEVWQPFNMLKKRALKSADLILAVSNHTKAEIIKLHGIEADKVVVFNNTIDPFFPLIDNFEKPGYLLERYRIPRQAPIILSVCRLSSTEAYKGYDTVLESLPNILKSHPAAKYLIVGKYDKIEKERLLSLAEKLGVKNSLYLIGFVPESELVDHFLLGNVFVMPSKNEGFGIVYIEAMACGIPVIAGNMDGSVDALANGELGILINPNDILAIGKAINEMLSINFTMKEKEDLRDKVISRFGFDEYKRRLNKILASL